LDIAIGQGDIHGMQTAKTRLAEIRQNRDKLFNLIGDLANARGQAQMQYGRAFDACRHAENEMEFLARRIPDLRQRLATARRREEDFSSPINIDNNSSAILSADLQKCETRYLALTGERVVEQFPARAA
jgi:chromosome segregation ATPase